MISEQNFMVHAVTELGVGRSLQEGSDQESKRTDLDIEKAQSSITFVSKEHKFTGLFQAVLV